MMRQRSCACPMCPRRFPKRRKAQYKRHVESHGLGCDSEPEEEERSSEAGRAVEQLESSGASAMRPDLQVIGGEPVRRVQIGSNESSVSSSSGAAVKRRHRCEKCGKCFAEKHNLKQHHGERPFECDICKKWFSRSAHLAGRIAAAHSIERPHKCGVCGKCFARMDHLRGHSRTHSNERRFDCTVCGKRFSKSSILTQHVRVHTGANPFVCKVCGKRFSQSSILIHHVRVHTGEKPFICKVCGKRFSESSSLTKHCVVHTAERQ